MKELQSAADRRVVDDPSIQSTKRREDQVKCWIHEVVHEIGYLVYLCPGRGYRPRRVVTGPIYTGRRHRRSWVGDLARPPPELRKGHASCMRIAYRRGLGVRGKASGDEPEVTDWDRGTAGQDTCIRWGEDGLAPGPFT